MHRLRVLLTGLVLGILMAPWLAGVAVSSQIGGALITPSTLLPNSGLGLTIDEIADGITSDASPFNGFAAALGLTGTIRLDLANAYNLTAFSLWNDINVFQEGISQFRLDFYDTSDAFISSSAIFVGPIGQLAPQTYTFAPVIGAKRVDLVVLTLNNSSCCGHRLEIREVEFTDEATPVESVTWSRIKAVYR